MRRSLLLPWLLLLAACAPSRPSTFRVVRDRCEPCRVEALAARLSGAGAEDCGWARADVDRPRLQACVLSAVQAGRPFRALATLPGIDSIVVAGYVRSPAGELAQLWYDSDPGGGSGRCRGTVMRTICDRLVADPKGNGKLLCEGRGEHTLLCGEQSVREERGGEQDASLLACNPLPRPGKRGACLRLAEPGGNVPGGQRLTCVPLSSAAPNFLMCRGGELESTTAR